MEPKKLTLQSLPVQIALAIGAIIVLILIASSLSAQMMTKPEDRTIDKKTQAEIIDSVSFALNEVYVFPDVAKEMEKHIRKNYKKGEYDTFTSLMKFLFTLTEDLREISHDKHLAVRPMADDGYQPYLSDTLPEEQEKRRCAENAYNNYGYQKIERLAGNVGYLDLRGFYDAEYAGPTAVAAMNYLANSSALIIDLRENGGGSPSMIQLMSSYFMDSLTHLNSFYVRKGDTTQQFYTLPYVPGKKMYDMPIFILTSSYTFSAAEEFTYNLKNLNRATIIGETTGGGAHPVDGRFFPNLHVALKLPFGRAVNPITGTNWEGTGIEPHISVPADQALERAHLEALKTIKEKGVIEYGEGQIDWAMKYLNAKTNPFEIDEATLKTYVGVYGPRNILFEDGVLIYQRTDRPKFKMIPIEKDLFMFDELDYFMLQVDRDDSGKIIGLIGLYNDGYTDYSPIGPEEKK